MSLLLMGDPIAGLIYPETLHETEFPKARSADLPTMLEMLREKYVWQYPQIRMHVLKHGVVPDASSGGTDEGDVQEFEDATNFDDLYGETVPDGYAAALQAETNPHGNLAVDATSTKVYQDPYWIHAHLNHTPSLKELQEFGIKEAMENALIVTCLLSMLREHEFLPGMAAQFFWKRHYFRIQTYKRVGYWFNTSIHLYVKFLAHLKGYGS